MGAPLDRVVLAEDVMPLPHLLLRSAKRAPDHEALIFPGTRLTYSQLAERAWQIASSLVAMGVEPGQHVGYLMTNNPDIVATFFGISMTGATIVPINARYRSVELQAIVEDADLVALLTHDSADEYVDFTQLIADAIPDFNPVVMLGERDDTPFMSRAEFDALADEATLRKRVEGLRVRDPALILYTSGTTSQPRGAILTHEAFVRVWMSSGRVFATIPADRQYNPLPLFHVAALGAMTWTIGHGATFISDYSWDAGRALRTMADEGATQFFPAYQPIMEGLLAHPDFASTDLSTLRVILNTCPPEVLEKFQQRIPHATQLTMYGGTEGGPATITRLDDPLRGPDEHLRAPAPGDRAARRRRRGPDARPGRAGDHPVPRLQHARALPQLAREDRRVDARRRLGDDERPRRRRRQKQVLFLGRAKETLKVGGENVAPQEVESHLCTHPAVKLAQVVGMPDDRLVEVPAAYVELLPGAEVDPQELIDYCKGRIASFKVPRLIRFIDGDEWPMSLTKIQRFALKERLLEELKRMIPSDLVLAQDVMPLGHLLLRSARRDPDHEALVFPDARFTYRELADRAWEVARSLLALGVQPRDHVGLLMTNHPEPGHDVLRHRARRRASRCRSTPATARPSWPRSSRTPTSSSCSPTTPPTRTSTSAR